MPIIIGGRTYYRTREACGMTGIGRSTLLQWLKRGIIRGASHRDRRGWRLFTEADIQRIQEEVNMVN